MKRATTKLMGAFAALLFTATLVSAQAPDTNNMTTITFSAPVSLPGVTLPAGSYLFKLADSQVNRHIVQVFDKDRSKIYATILAIPAERNEPADETVITFGESPANTPPAIRYWYYPGQKIGQEFAYPKQQAQEIANAAHTSVLAVDTEDTSADALAKGNVSRVEPSAPANESAAQSAQPSTSQSTQNTMTQSSNAAATTPAESSPSAQATPAESAPSAQSTQQHPMAQSQTSTTERPSTTASAQSPAPTTSTPSASRPSRTQGAVGTSGRASLPKTASTVPLVGFAGLLALASAFSIRALRRAYA